jgi:hypothetical protein
VSPPAQLWPAGAATGLGSLPGTDPVESSRLVLGEVASLPYLPELPGRGLGADLVGRTAALLVDLPTEWKPHGWTLASHAGRDLARARDHLNRDLDAFTEQAGVLDLVKVQVCGPLTLAAQVELPNLHKALTDHGAFQDLSASLAEGVRLHLADLRRRLPGAAIVLQVDEPSMPAVLAGQVPTPSGYGTVRALDPATALGVLTAVLDVAPPGGRVVHCCARDTPIELIASAGADAVAVDSSLLDKAALDALGQFVDDGGALWLGIVPGADGPIDFNRARRRVTGLWNKLGFNPDLLAARVVPTPTCGLAGASPPYTRRVMALLRDVGRSLVEGAPGA